MFWIPSQEAPKQTDRQKMSVGGLKVFYIIWGCWWVTFKTGLTNIARGNYQPPSSFSTCQKVNLPLKVYFSTPSGHSCYYHLAFLALFVLEIHPLMIIQDLDLRGSAAAQACAPEASNRQHLKSADNAAKRTLIFNEQTQRLFNDFSLLPFDLHSFALMVACYVQP